MINKTIIFLLLTANLAFGQVGIGELNPTAMLEIKTENSGIAALGLGVQTNPQGSADGQMTVIGDKLYLFDADRDKWMSVESTILEFGRLGWGSVPREIEYGGGDVQIGALMPFDGTITSISIKANNVQNNRQILLFLGDTPVPNNDLDPDTDGTFDLSPSVRTILTNTYNVDFNAGQRIHLEVDPSVSTDDITNLTILVTVKWRKDNI